MEDTFSSNERLVSLTPLLEPTDKFHVLCTWNIKQKAAELCHVTIDFVPNSMLLVICERVTMNSCGAIFFRHSWLACQSVLLLCKDLFGNTIRSSKGYQPDSIHTLPSRSTM